MTKSRHQGDAKAREVDMFALQPQEKVLAHNRGVRTRSKSDSDPIQFMCSDQIRFNCLYVGSVRILFKFFSDFV